MTGAKKTSVAKARSLATKELTKEEKLKLIDALEEKKRRQREARAAFVPNEGQSLVIKSKAFTKVVLSGNGSGKTAMGVNIALWAALGYNPVTQERYQVPAKVYVVLDKPDKIEQTWMPEIKKWYNLKPEQLHKRGKPYYASIQFDNGSEITFLFHDQEPMTFESIEGSWFIFDEPPPRHVWIGLRRAGRTKNTVPRYLIIGTPISGSWVRTDIYEPWAKGELPDTECFRYGTAVNEHNLAAGYMESFGRFLTEKEKRVRFEGQFFDLDGLGLAHLWKRDVHLVNVEWNPRWPVVIGLDPHTRKKHHAIMLGISPEGYFFVLKELALKCLPAQFAEELAEWAHGYKVIDVVCDNLGSGELTGGMGALSFIQVLNKTWKEMGEQLRARPTSFHEKQDEAWLAMIQECLHIPLEADNMGQVVPKLRVAKECVGLTSDIETVSWYKIKNSEELKPKLDMEKKDFLSCLKYALATQPRFDTRKDRVIRPGRSPWMGSAKNKGDRRSFYLEREEDDDF